jgi:hypothetical protein
MKNALMWPFSHEKAANFRHLLPKCIQDHLPDEEAPWKSALFEGLPAAIGGDDWLLIEFWLTALDSYQGCQTFSLTLDEIQQMLCLLFGFIITTEHHRLSSSACKLFTDIYRPRHMHFDMVLPWRPLYSVLQRLLFSNSKTSVHKTMPVFFRTFIPFVRSCNSMFAETATEEMIALWRPLLDLHHSCFVMAHCLLCLFLPTHTGKHHLWFLDFLSIWPMYKAAHWDYQ